MVSTSRTYVLGSSDSVWATSARSPSYLILPLKRTSNSDAQGSLTIRLSMHSRSPTRGSLSTTSLRASTLRWAQPVGRFRADRSRELRLPEHLLRTLRFSYSTRLLLHSTRRMKSRCRLPSTLSGRSLVQSLLSSLPTDCQLSGTLTRL